MNIGFTGTRQGMTGNQRDKIETLLLAFGPTMVFHGDCTGADKDFDMICVSLEIPRTLYPGVNSQGFSPTRAYCQAEVIHDPAPYIERDHTIIDSVDLMLACPSGDEVLRSGTWATIRYAKKIDRPLIIVMP